VVESNPGLISLVVPVYNEADNILPLLEALQTGVVSNHETLLVYDFDEDTTLPPAREFSERYDALHLLKNTIGPGVLNALKTGLEEAQGDVVVVTMADLSDDVSQIDEMASRVRNGDGVVAASRYMRGGQQVGGPLIKSSLSRLAGLSLHWLTGIKTHDATNNFKAYDYRLLRSHSIESHSGFELGLELTVKAYLSGFPISELPTTWRDRTAGESRFRVLKWIPGYLRWYLTALLGSWTGRARRAGNARSRRIRSSPPRSADVSTE
jgi:dolichol-phosphate mannosyltransferase